MNSTSPKKLKIEAGLYPLDELDAIAKELQAEGYETNVCYYPGFGWWFEAERQ